MKTLSRDSLELPSESLAQFVGSSIQHITSNQLNDKLRRVYRVAPFSQAAMDVFAMTQQCRYSAEQIAAAIQRAPWLSAEILAKSNSSFYNPGGERLTDLAHAVARIGQKRVGELALVSNALFFGTKQSLAWMDLELTWRRSLAAGVAIEYLVDQGNHYEIDDGLVIAATMHLSGRAALGSIYPRLYRRMIEQCRCDNRSLVEFERHVFPEEHTRILAKLLEGWGIPAQVYAPLAHSMESYSTVAQLPEPQRSRVELLKVAVSIGALASKQWHPWDLIDFPPIDVLCRLGISNLTRIVESTAHDASAIAALRKQGESIRARESGRYARYQSSQVVKYVNLSSYSYDVLLHVLESIPGIRIEHANDCEPLSEAALINVLGATHRVLCNFERIMTQNQHTFFCDSFNAQCFANSGQAIVVPCSFGIFSSVCAGISTTAELDSLTTDQSPSILQERNNNTRSK